MPIPSDPRDLASLQAGKPSYRGRGAREKNERLHAEENDVSAQVSKIRDCTQSNWRVTEKWREAAEESYDFVENNQWDEKDKAYLENQGRHAMTFNKILPQVRLLSGMERQNREELRVFPREGSDTQDSDIMTGLVKYVLDENLAPWELTRKSNDVYICGRGFIGCDISHDENINGDVLIERLNPFSCFWDTLSDKWSGMDMRWIQYGPWVTEEEAKELWPDFADMIKVGDWLSGDTPVLAAGVQVGDKHFNDKLFLDGETRRVRALMHWYKRREVVKIAVNYSTGDVKYAEDENFLEEFQSLSEQQRQAFVMIDRKMTCVRVATVMHRIITQDKPSPFKHNMLPIIPYIGLQFMNEPWGLVEYLKDPQRLGNKSISQTLNHLNRSANSGWLNHETEGADPGILEKFGSTPGTNISYKNVKPDRIEPARLDAGHMALAQAADQIINETSLLNAELQGISTQRTVSGRAIEARQRGGMIGNEDFFDNQLLGDKILGYQLIANIQQAYTRARIVRILGAQSVKSPEVQASKVYAELNQDTDQLFQVVDRCLKADYDYVVDRSPQSVTIRMQQFETLMKAAKEFPGSIPPDVLVDASDFPENIKSRIKEHLQKMQGMQDMAMQQQAMAGAMGGANGAVQ